MSNVLPMTYAVEALQEVEPNVEPTGTFWRDVAVVAGSPVGAHAPTGARRGVGRLAVWPS